MTGVQTCALPIYDGRLSDAEKTVQQQRHPGVERRFAFRQCAVQVENNQLFHDPRIYPTPVPAYTPVAEKGAWCWASRSQ